jgi:uncharacterized protein (TIGR00255 family)
MTGFGVGDERLAHGRVIAEIRSVNQRFLEIRARLPREFAELSIFAEQVVRERLRRGRIELSVRTEGSVLSPCVLDKARAAAAFRALEALRDEIAPGVEVPLSLLGAVPDLFVPPAGSELEAVRAAVKSAIDGAMDAMEAMCRLEGDVLLSDLRGRCAVLKAVTEQVAGRADQVRDAACRRLRERLERLLADAAVTASPGRLEAEVLMLADRGDITEELTRLRSHLDQFEAALAQRTPEPVGRRLDFLLQEMLRESNTIGAKAQDALISQEVVTIKVELERLREQVQNVE